MSGKGLAYRAAIGVAAVLAVTWVAFYLHVNLPSAGFLYVLLILIVALRLGFITATISSFFAVNCLNYFFVTPVLSFRIYDRQDWIALITFELTALVVSRLSTQVQEQARIASQRSLDRQKLFQLSQGVLQMEPHRPATLQTLTLIQQTLRPGSSALFDAADAVTHSLGENSAQQELAAQEAFRLNLDHNDPVSGAWSRVLRSGGTPIGAIALRSIDLNAEIVDAVASVAVIAIERSRSMERAAQAESARHTEQLRTAVLDSLAHAFKTPLTSIRAASSGLLEDPSLLGSKRDLISIVDRESERLNNLTTHLLRTARLDQAPAKPMELCDLGEIIYKVLGDLAWELNGRPVNTHIAESITEVRGDRELIEMGITQIVDNAAKYSTPGSVINVSVERNDQETVVSIHNEGPPIHPDDRERIFERFFRGQGTKDLAAGTGIGLSVTKKAAEAHGGRVWVQSEEGHGTTVYFALSSG